MWEVICTSNATNISLGDGSYVMVPPVDQPRPMDYCVWEWTKEMIYSVKVRTRNILLGRITIKFVLEQTTKAQRVSRGSYLNLGARWGWVVNATHWPL